MYSANGPAANLNTGRRDRHARSQIRPLAHDFSTRRRMPRRPRRCTIYRKQGACRGRCGAGQPLGKSLAGQVPTPNPQPLTPQRRVSMSNRIGAHLRFVGDYVRSNLLVALEYRASFASQILGMAINDGMWLTFWWIYFTRFQILQGGWQIDDVLAMWAIAATGFGLC